MLDGLNLGVGGGIRLGGGSSPMVAGASTAGSPTASEAGFGAGSTSGSGRASGLFGTSPGHLAIHLPIIALVVLVLVRQSLPK